jgi:hypothetical protein
LLTITPGNPWINFALSTILFFVVSKELYRLSRAPAPCRTCSTSPSFLPSFLPSCLPAEHGKGERRKPSKGGVAARGSPARTRRMPTTPDLQICCNNNSLLIC